MTHDPEYLSITHYAERYDMSPQTVRKLLHAGLLESIGEGKLIRVLNRPFRSGRARYPERRTA